MKIRCAVLAGAIALLSFVPPVPAQSAPDAANQINPPLPVNLDVPPQVVPDPGEIEAEALAVEAIQEPQSFHDWILQMHPDRAAAEHLEALAELYPDVYARAHPKTPNQAAAEAIAAHAILNPHFPLTVGPN
jgi:hypothetical protein